MNCLKILFLSIFLGIGFNKTISNAQNTIAESVIEYCEEHVINYETIRWSGDAILNCLFFNPKINKDLIFEYYKSNTSSTDKRIKKLLFFKKQIKSIEFQKEQNDESRWVARFSFYDNSLILGRILDNERPNWLIGLYFSEGANKNLTKFLEVPMDKDFVKWMVQDVKTDSSSLAILNYIYENISYVKLKNVNAEEY